MGFINKLTAFDEVMDNAYGMISTANFVVVLHRDEGTTQSSTVLGGSGEPVLQHAALAPLLPGESHMVSRGNALPLVLPFDLNGHSCSLIYRRHASRKTHFLTKFQLLSSNLTLEKRVLGFLGLISVQKNWVLHQI